MQLDLPLPKGMSARPARRDDLPAVCALVTAYEEAVLGQALVDLADLESDWAVDDFDEQRTLVVLRGQDMVGYVDANRPGGATACVHPRSWRQGVGSALVRWLESSAAARGATRVGQTVPDADEDAAGLLQRRGWAPLWTSWVLAFPDDVALPPRPAPRGYSLRPFRPGVDDHAAYRVIEDAFSEWPDRDPTSYRDWAAHVVERAGFEPWQLMLAVHGPVESGPVVGACYLVLADGTAWIDKLAVARDHRGAGLAHALLAESAGAARSHGVPRIVTSTDSRTGARPFYERLGMRSTESFTRWSKLLD